jgi:hypothetical protein
MENKRLYRLWAGLYILCAALGFIPTATGFWHFLLVAVALGFFVPPTLLLLNARKNSDQKTARLMCKLSALSLSLTLAFLVLNLLSGNSPRWVWDAMYGLLIMVSSPMACARYWFLSLFCWACLLFGSLSLLKKK